MFECIECGDIILVPTKKVGNGYGINKEGHKVCYSCCAKQELESMVETGKATLYYNGQQDAKRTCGTNPTVTNWSGTLSFKVLGNKVGRHNFAGVRYDYWFRTPDDKLWHGYTIGDFTQVAHCKQVKG